MQLGTITVDGRTETLVNILRSGPNAPASSYVLSGGRYVVRIAGGWNLEERGRYARAVTVTNEPAQPVVDPATCCPGCSGPGKASTVAPADVALLECQACFGVFTPRGGTLTPAQATSYAARVYGPMLANAGSAGSFYFDIDVVGSDGLRRRMHGFADRATRRVIQWG